GGGFADHPIPALATVSLGKAALRSAATMLGADLEPDGIRVATLTIAGTIVAGTSFDPERIAERYWEVCPRGRPMAARIPVHRRVADLIRIRPVKADRGICTSCPRMPSVRIYANSKYGRSLAGPRLRPI